MNGSWHFPLDPKCPTVAEFEESLYGDPMTSAMGAPTGEIMAGFARKHRSKCARCREYGCANVEANYEQRS